MRTCVFRILITLVLLLVSGSLFSQVAVNADGSSPDNSAMLDVKSTNRGLLISRISTDARDQIPSPAAGLLIYNKSTNQFNYFNGSYWCQLETNLVSSSIGSLSVTGGISINIAPDVSPKNSAMLDINNPSRGILLPRTTPDLIVAPATGLIIYNIAANLFNFYDGAEWVSLCATSTGVTGAGGSQPPVGYAVKENGSDPDPSAMLDISATHKGVLIPRLTNAQRDSILPTNGLIIYNTSSNNIEFFNGSSWYRFSTNLISPPASGNQIPSPTQIIWKWNTVPGATGYKWNTSNDYSTSLDMGAATTVTETGLNNNTSYTRYVWSYNNCGPSTDKTTLVASTPLSDAPVISSPAAFLVPENQTAVGQVIASEAEGSTLTYALSGADAPSFNISNAGVITFKVAPDYEMPGSAASSNVYSTTVTVTDTIAHSTAQNITITVTDVPDVPYSGDEAQWFDGTIANISGTYYLIDKTTNNRNAALRDVPCMLTSSGSIASLRAADFATNNADYILTVGDAHKYEFEFVHTANPSANKLLYYNGADGNNVPGIRIMVNTAGKILLYYSNGASWMNITSANALVIGYNKVTVNFDLGTMNASIVVNATTTNFTNTLSGGSFANTNCYFLYGVGSQSFVCNMIRFRFTKNAAVLHEYYFNDGIYYPGSSNYYIVPDLIGTFDLYLNGFTANPFTAVQNTDYYLQDNGYDIYVNNQYPDKLYICPKRVSGVTRASIGSYSSKFVFLENVPPTVFGYYAWGKIDMNPTNSPDAFYSQWDITNRSFWSAAIESDPYYNAVKKYWIHKSWLNRAKLDAYTITTQVLANTGSYYFYDVAEYQQKSIENIVLYNNQHSRSALADNAYNKRVTNIYMKRPLKTGTTTGWLVAVSGSKYLFKDGNNLYFSADKGLTYGSAFDISTLATLSLSDKFYFTPTGAIIFIPIGRKVFRSADNNTTWAECSYKDTNGAPFIFHTPVNPAYPGNYFNPMDGWYAGSQMLIIGDYANGTGTGAAPVIIWYSIDDGITWKVGYEFGQNPFYSDNGTANGGTGGNLLGNPANPLKVRHIHGVNRNPFDHSYWFFTGDGNTQNQWMKGVYDSISDSWNWTALKSAANTNAERFRTINIVFKDANTIIASADGFDASGEIMWTVPINDLNTLSSWIPINFPKKTASIYWFRGFADGRLIAFNNASPIECYYSLDWGTTWTRFRGYSPRTNNEIEWNIVYPADADEYFLSPGTSTFTEGLIKLKL